MARRGNCKDRRGIGRALDVAAIPADHYKGELPGTFAMKGNCRNTELHLQSGMRSVGDKQGQ